MNLYIDDEIEGDPNFNTEAEMGFFEDVHNGNVSSIEYWVNGQGVNVDVLDKSCPVGSTALVYAILRGNEAMVECLCRLGADVNLAVNEKAPYQYALEVNNPRIKTCLRLKGAKKPESTKN